MKNLIFACFALGIVTLVSCKKEQDPSPIVPESSQPTFSFQSQPGSYWVYLVYKIDTTGTETLLSYRDSVYVMNDSIINGQSYKHYRGTWLGNTGDLLMRDSSGFIVNPFGNILYNYIGYTDTVSSHNDGIFTSYGMTASGTFSITTPAITSTCLDHQIHFYQSNGTTMSPCDSVWIKHDYYNVNTGEELISYYALSAQLDQNCTYMERRLVAYRHGF